MKYKPSTHHIGHTFVLCVLFFVFMTKNVWAKHHSSDSINAIKSTQDDYRNYVTFGYGYSVSANKIKSGVFDVDDSDEDILVNSYKNMHLDDRCLYKVAIGQNYKYLRLELEYIHMPKIAVSDQSIFINDNEHIWSYKLSTNTLFANIYHDFNMPGDKLSLYLGAGLGASNNYITEEHGDYVQDGEVLVPDLYVYPKGNKTTFAWNVTLGLKVNITNNVYIDLGYKFLDTGKTANSTSQTRLDDESPHVYRQTEPNVKGNIKRHAVICSLGMKF
jgi:opacity protein-like surface antigen